MVVDWGIAKVIRHEESSDLLRLVRTDRSIRGVEEEDGLILGTPLYMSPEQAWGDVGSMDHRSDIYSLGAILHEVLRGESKHLGSVHEILDSKRRGYGPSGSERDQKPRDTQIIHPKIRPLKPVSHREAGTEASNDRNAPCLPAEASNLPKELVLICEKAMSYDVEQRHQSTMELAKEIQSWLEGAQRREKALGIVEQSKTY